MEKQLPARPNIEHLKGQAKSLLADLNSGLEFAAQCFIDHLPEARSLSIAEVQGKSYRLADAQSVIARRNGFDSWAQLSKHVEELRNWEGTWEFVDLEVDGFSMHASSLRSSRLLVDGDRFRIESPEATYEGIFTINLLTTPNQIDIDFVEGPEAGNRSLGIYELHGDHLKLCLGLTGVARPIEYKTSPGSGHALENFKRSSSSRPEKVDGGKPPARTAVPKGDPADFPCVMTSTLERLQGEWSPVMLSMGGKALAADMLGYGKRTMEGNETKVIFGGQLMVHALVRINEDANPIEIDYLNLGGPSRNAISAGILEWSGDIVRFCMGEAGGSRPSSFDPGKGIVLSEWKKLE